MLASQSATTSKSSLCFCRRETESTGVSRGLAVTAASPRAPQYLHKPSCSLGGLWGCRAVGPSCRNRAAPRGTPHPKRCSGWMPHTVPWGPGCCPSATPSLATEALAPQPNPRLQVQHLHDPFDGIDGRIQERAGPWLVTAVVRVSEAQEEDVGWQVWERSGAALRFVVCRRKQESWDPGSYGKLVLSQAGCCPSNSKRMSSHRG